MVTQANGRYFEKRGFPSTKLVSWEKENRKA
jgi:hypothetical protein